MLFSNIFETVRHKHVMLLYTTDDQRNDVTINLINGGLEKEQLCLCVLFDPYNNGKFNITNLFSKIKNYHENIQKGNLQIINYRPYYESLLNQDLIPLKEMTLKIKEASTQSIDYNKGRGVLVITDIESTFLFNKKYREGIIMGKFFHDTFLEWKQNSHNITLVCLHRHPLTSFIQGDRFIDIKNTFVNLHTHIIDFEDYFKQ